MGFSWGRVLAGTICLFAFCTAAAQQREVSGRYPLEKNQKSLQLQLGTSGAGLDFKYQLSERLTGRAGVTAAIFSISGLFNGTDFKSDSKLSGRFSNAHILADITPFKKFRTIRAVAGAAYFMQAEGNLFIKPSEVYHYGDIPVTGDMLGDVTMDISWKGFAPYIGLGIIKNFPRKKFNLNLDAGTYYLQQPKSTITGTGLLEGNKAQEPVLQRNIRAYRILPLLQLNFNYKL
ncbi:hypothetical protein [Arcticibacter tournemirensis]|uniref:Outer membrane protein beta-barrel domain-containing protein n=1 Tax=Arcticibacter tournemirensis TaxID=699437 RepID=A0A4Q0M9X2_9SPHI|nr:hypothetical protein [Arcticibacter tournemirensis]RXF70020.1 hypothetical protein EKH83_09015 [Arcticibacter tournemirensis]